MRNFDVKDLALAQSGQTKIEWAGEHMPVVRQLSKEFARKKPLKGSRIAACLHVTSETANLMIALQAGGAEVVLCASNPLSTQDDVAAALVKVHGASVFAVRGEDDRSYYRHINQALDALRGSSITMDDGADLISTVHSRRKECLRYIKGGTEETTTGVVRLKSLARSKKLRFPVIAVNDAQTKHFFDNRYGTGQSTIDGILRATNVLLAGTTVVVAGYGWCGRGVAMRAKGMGAQVIVTEVDAVRALEATMDGYRVLSMMEAARIGQLFITLTGDISVLRKEHFAVMRDGAIVANSGHFNVEIDLDVLKSMSRSRRKIRNDIEAFTLRNGRTINVLAEGRLVNLAAAEGHPASVMDMSFANQALSAEYLLRNYRGLQRQVYPVPEYLDRRIAELKLKAMGVTIDQLTPKQKKYLASWEFGT